MGHLEISALASALTSASASALQKIYFCLTIFVVVVVVEN